MTDEPHDRDDDTADENTADAGTADENTAGAGTGDDDPSDEDIGGRWSWTTALDDAQPDWSALRDALRALRPSQLFRWEAAHLLPDGTRVDEFVHRWSAAPLVLGTDGRTWDLTGMAPGAVGPSVLLVPGRKDLVAHVVGTGACDRCCCLAEARRASGRAGDPWPGRDDARHGDRPDDG